MQDTKRRGPIPGLGRSPGGGHGNPLQYSCLENPMDREARRAMFHRVAKTRTRLKWVSTHLCMWNREREAKLEGKETSTNLVTYVTFMWIWMRFGPCSQRDQELTWKRLLTANLLHLTVLNQDFLLAFLFISFFTESEKKSSYFTIQTGSGNTIVSTKNSLSRKVGSGEKARVNLGDWTVLSFIHRVTKSWWFWSCIGYITRLPCTWEVADFVNHWHWKPLMAILYRLWITYLVKILRIPLSQQWSWERALLFTRIEDLAFATLVRALTSRNKRTHFFRADPSLESVHCHVLRPLHLCWRLKLPGLRRGLSWACPNPAASGPWAGKELKGFLLRTLAFFWMPPSLIKNH